MPKDEKPDEIEKPQKPDAPYIWWRERRPGYWYSKKILVTLANFQELLRHYTVWDEKQARPLQEVFPKNTIIPEDHWQKRQLVEKEINRLIPAVGRYLYMAGIFDDVCLRDKQIQSFQAAAS